ncbi:ubiquitin-conjugating enzyme E2 7-like isoform X1 [Malania oleifera]|uniref:ubiquitin-conjugating enzyme E2 7-like isoform X1 n=1 Tax=Malania oleifera TaxID=397392 RepID=UPI0025AEBAA2|nr:ubiquitin-conjugating enzyme E2 7-like isoform X1 [Malania oleifera]
MASATQASLLLQKQLKDLCKRPVDGFSAGLVDETNVFEWSVSIIGPPDTLYDGGFFNAIMSFPPNYPNSPPSVRFTSEIWHPNVYPDGRVCISILHPPGDDPNGYELASERWSPVHTVESIVLSIISMLSSPNDESPANIEAAQWVMANSVGGEIWAWKGIRGTREKRKALNLSPLAIFWCAWKETNKRAFKDSSIPHQTCKGQWVATVFSWLSGKIVNDHFVILDVCDTLQRVVDVLYLGLTSP